MRRIRAALLVAALGLTLAACEAGDQGLEVRDGAAPQAEEPGAEEPGDPEDQLGRAPSQPPEASEDGPHGDLACDEETAAGIVAAIDGQLSAVADDDYAGALEFSARAYREATTPEQFRQIIEQDYPLLTDAAEHAAQVCVAQDDEAEVLVTVTDTLGATQDLVYTMAREDGTWLVALAGSVEAPGEEPQQV